MSKSLTFPDLDVQLIDENPRLRYRTVPMKVLVLGFPRTGTSSIQRALETLGFGPCYHMRTTINEYPRDCEMWLDAFRRKADGRQGFGVDEWDSLLGRYQSVCDLPAIAFAPDLMQTYPTAKVILTNRDPAAWHASMGKTLLQAQSYWAHTVLQYVDWVTSLVHALRLAYWRHLFQDDFHANGCAAMKAHYGLVRESAKAQGREVLEFELDDGWEPLCRFLGAEVPDCPYPRENEGGAWVVKMRRRAWGRTKAVGVRWARFIAVILLAIVSSRWVVWPGLRGFM